MSTKYIYIYIQIQLFIMTELRLPTVILDWDNEVHLYSRIADLILELGTFY